jgi:hypothetical protein
VTTSQRASTRRKGCWTGGLNTLDTCQAMDAASLPRASSDRQVFPPPASPAARRGGGWLLLPAAAIACWCCCCLLLLLLFVGRRYRRRLLRAFVDE